MMRWNDDIVIQPNARKAPAARPAPRVAGLLRRLRAIAAALLFSGAALAAPAVRPGPQVPVKGPTVRLKQEALVKGATVCLGDIARIAGEPKARAALAALEIGPAPLPGYSRSINPDYVRIRLRQKNLDPAILAADSAPACTVIRSSQTVASDRFVVAARALLEGTIERGDGRLVVEPVSRPRDLVLPDGTLELLPEEAGAASGAFRRVTVRATVDGEEAGRVDVSLRVRRYQKVAVARQAIGRGEPIPSDAVSYEERDRMSLPDDVLTENDSLDSLQATQPIAAGSVIGRRVAQEPPLVHRGDSVTLLARVGGIEVSAAGVAAEDGRLGQTIRVRSGAQDARATVRDSRTVEASVL